MATTEVVDVCLETRPIDEKDFVGLDPLLLASSFTRDPQVIKLLIGSGANPDTSRNAYGQSAFLIAILMNGTPKIIAEFLDAGADVNRSKNGLTALHLLASLLDNEKLSEAFFVDMTSPFEKFDLVNLTEFAFRPESSLISLLIAAGADINAKKPPEQMTPISIAAMMNDSPHTIDLLIELDANVNIPSIDGETPLIMANYSSENPTVGLQLVAAGANVNVRNKDGKTAIFSTAFRKLKSATELATFVDALLDAGADINVTTDALETPLHNAMFGQANPFLAKILVDRGADLNPIDADGHTPLHNGVISAHDPDRILLLLHAGADPSIMDAEGKMPWDYIDENETLSEAHKALLADALMPNGTSR